MPKTRHTVRKVLCRVCCSLFCGCLHGTTTDSCDSIGLLLHCSLPKENIGELLNASWLWELLCYRL